MPGGLTEIMLQAWEDGRAASPGERGLILLRVAAPAMPEASRAELTVGQRDAALLDLFERLFGGTVAALADCPSCSEPLELDVPVGAVRVPGPATAAEPRILAWAGHEIAFRLPNAGDLSDIGHSGASRTVGSVARWLAQRCTLTADLAIDDAAAEALETAIEGAVMRDDPQAVVTLEFDCPSCARHWSARFDVVEFLWRRLDSFVRELLRDVHLLASAYGWSERDILALPAWRRLHYLELLGA